MRRTTIGTIAALAFCASTVVAQVATMPVNNSALRQTATVRQKGELSTVLATRSVKENTSFPSSPLSTQVSVTGADVLPISSRYDIVSNGRAAHNLVVDPDDPNKMHFISMVLTDNTEADTSGANAFSSRRVQYSYSSDGGKTWKAPVILGGVRLGYPDIVLYKHNGVNVPIIAAHNGPNSTGNTNWVTKVFFEQGQPGDGNFASYDCDRTASDQSTKDIGYPSLALSPNQDKLYVLGCVLQASSSASAEPLEFGYFDLSGAQPSWKGWKNHPGGDAASAICNGGVDLMRVAADGKIGVLWGQGDNSDAGLYFVESNDGGATWTSPYLPLYVPDASDGNLSGASLVDYDGLDFWYDGTGRPHFMWQMDYQLLGQNRFYPYTGMVCYWALGDKKVQILNTIYQPQFTSLQIGNDFIDDTILYQPTYFTAPASGAGYEPTGIPFISKVTTTLSPNPNYFMVLYNTFQDNDTMTVDELGDGSSIKVYLFRDIYFQQTTDGGATWSEPAPFMANDPTNTDPTTKLDFHYPAPALNSPAVGGNTQYHVNFVADTFPGQQFGNGMPGWTFNTWYHKVMSTSAVRAENVVASNMLGANYPNPAAVSTTVPVTLAQPEAATLSVEDILGRPVRTVFRGTLSAGTTNIPVETASLVPGVYRFVLTTATGSASGMMSVVH